MNEGSDAKDSGTRLTYNPESKLDKAPFAHGEPNDVCVTVYKNITGCRRELHRQICEWGIWPGGRKKDGDPHVYLRR